MDGCCVWTFTGFIVSLTVIKRCTMLRSAAGIPPHDDGPLYSPKVVTISLGGPALLSINKRQQDGSKGELETEVFSSGWFHTSIFSLLGSFPCSGKCPSGSSMESRFDVCVWEEKPWLSSSLVWRGFILLGWLHACGWLAISQKFCLWLVSVLILVLWL